MATASERLREEGWDLAEGHPLDDEPGEMLLSSTAQVRTLADGTRLRLLSALTRRPASAKQLAARFGVPTTRLYHHLGLLEEHGYIEVVATRQSGARTERCYGVPPRTTARVGPGLTADADRDALAEAFAAIVEVAAVGLAESIRAGRVDLHEEEDQQRAVISYTTARLTADEQRGFAARAGELVRDIAEASTANAAVEEQGGSTDAEPVLLLTLLVPDVLMPADP